MSRTWACTFIEKSFGEDSYEHGCNPKSRNILVSQQCYLKAMTLPDLIEKINDTYAIKIDDCFIGTDNDNITAFSYNRIETADGSEPTAAQNKQFKKGKIRLWLADYWFAIASYETVPITLDDLRKAGIKYHE